MHYAYACEFHRKGSLVFPGLSRIEDFIIVKCFLNLFFFSDELAFYKISDRLEISNED